MTYYKKEERWALTYVSSKDGTTKVCYPRSKEKKEEQLAICKERGIKVLSCKKLYPFSTEKNQHNFELIRNICWNTMYDMQSGEIPYDEAEYDRLEATKEKADRFFGLPLPIAWLPYEEWSEAKELATAAIIHRQEACIRNGRPDLVQYC